MEKNQKFSKTAKVIDNHEVIFHNCTIANDADGACWYRLPTRSQRTPVAVGIPGEDGPQKWEVHKTYDSDNNETLYAFQVKDLNEYVASIGDQLLIVGEEQASLRYFVAETGIRPSVHENDPMYLRLASSNPAMYISLVSTRSGTILALADKMYAVLWHIN